MLGKGKRIRQVLLPEIVSRSLLSLRGDASANDLLSNSISAAKDLSRLVVTGQLEVQPAKVLKRIREIRMVGPEPGFLQCDRLQKEG